MEESKRRRMFIQGLRDMADFFENHPDLKFPHYSGLNVFVNTREEIAEIARQSTWSKVYAGHWFCLRKQFGSDLTLEINISREEVCRKVVTGTRVVPAMPAMPATEETVEEVTEWVCDETSLLADYKEFNK